jgi:hypothetical protein
VVYRRPWQPGELAQQLSEDGMGALAAAVTAAETACRHVAVAERQLEEAHRRGPGARVLWQGLVRNTTQLRGHLGEVVARAAMQPSLLRQHMACCVSAGVIHTAPPHRESRLGEYLRAMCQPRGGAEPLAAVDLDRDRVEDELRQLRTYMEIVLSAWAAVLRELAVPHDVGYEENKMYNVEVLWRWVEQYATYLPQYADRAYALAQAELFDWRPDQQGRELPPLRIVARRRAEGIPVIGDYNSSSPDSCSDRQGDWGTSG